MYMAFAQMILCHSGCSFVLYLLFRFYQHMLVVLMNCAAASLKERILNIVERTAIQKAAEKHTQEVNQLQAAMQMLESEKNTILNENKRLKNERRQSKDALRASRERNRVKEQLSKSAYNINVQSTEDESDIQPY